jgi:nucleotide-binding universal stress UspA family protein
MDNRLLVPLDGTESPDEILRYAKSILPKSNTEITLLCVLAKPDSPCSPHAERIFDDLVADGWTVKGENRMGDPVEEIIKFAILQPTTLILMSTHGRTGLERIREGSVTEQVLRQSPCPVFILHSTRAEPADPTEPKLFKRILVPLDGTDTSASILDCVGRFARAHDSEVIIFHDEMVGPEDEHKRTAIKTKLEDHSVALANTGLKVSLDMGTFRRPIREILHRIDDLKIGLVSMATHGDSGEPRALEESVTAEVIRHANCPLLVWSSDPQCPELEDD